MVFHDDNLYRIVDECSFSIRSWGYISEIHPGLPPKVHSFLDITEG